MTTDNHSSLIVVKNFVGKIFYGFHNFTSTKCAGKLMKNFMQGGKFNATSRSVRFTDSLMVA